MEGMTTEELKLAIEHDEARKGRPVQQDEAALARQMAVSCAQMALSCARVSLDVLNGEWHREGEIEKFLAMSAEVLRLARDAKHPIDS